MFSNVLGCLDWAHGDPWRSRVAVDGDQVLGAATVALYQRFGFEIIGTVPGVAGASTLDVQGKLAGIDLVVGSVTDQTLASYQTRSARRWWSWRSATALVTVGGARSETAGAAKIIAVKGGRGVTVNGSMNVKVGGAVVNIANADRSEVAGGGYTEESPPAPSWSRRATWSSRPPGMLSVVMGASTITLMPAVVAVAGLSLKIDGDVTDTAAIIVDN